MERNVDLHIHSSFSDGFYTPEQILKMASENGVKKMSITDHDTISAYSENTVKLAKELNIELIKGVEISTNYENFGVHILGYGFDIENKELKKSLELLNASRLNYFAEVSFVLESLGFVVNVEEISKAHVVTKSHIAKDIVLNPKNKELLENLYGYIPGKGEFIETMMNEGCPAFVQKFALTPAQASEIIHNAGGKVVLAHPMAYIYEDGVSKETLMNLLDEINADGVEADYLYVDRNNVLHDDRKEWNEVAKLKNLIVTVGSDFHNFNEPRPEIGFANKKEMM